jgi:alpha-D-ribose 1-methylphosphonate 5-triphosphate diphosphatase PhnM
MDTIAILRTLVGFDTTSRLSNLPLVHWTVAYPEEHGARIRLSYDDDGRKANVLASLGPGLGVSCFPVTPTWYRSMVRTGTAIHSASPNAAGASTAAGLPI